MKARRLLLMAVAAVVLASFGCGKSHTGPGVALPPRTYMMGFSGIPPRPDINVLIATIQMWSERADAAIMHVEPPWDSLLAGFAADGLVARNQLELAHFYRALGLRLVITIDATNGLDRSSEADLLVVAGRSLTELQVQQLYRRYAAAVDSLLEPDYLGLAAETNLIRAVAPPALYTAVVQAANGAAGDILGFDPSRNLYVSVQVEAAWGRLVGGGGYEGVQQDLTDFPFIRSLGLSSYPYLGGFDDPDELPLDYYARLGQGHTLPMLVVEGGWSSDTVGVVPSTRDKQARYIVKQAALLDQARAVGVFQLTFADLDLDAIPLPPGSILPYFASLGLVDADLDPKPALDRWDAVYARALR